MAIPPSFVLTDTPPNDPACKLLGYLYLPNVNTWGPGPYPAVIATRNGGFTDGGPGESDAMFHDLALNGYICMFFDTREAKDLPPPPQQKHFGLQPPSGPQSSDGCWPAQTDDCQIGMRYMRAHPLVKGFMGAPGGFVAMVGGSGSGGHAAYMGATGILNDTRPDAVIGLSAMFNGGERAITLPTYQAFIDKNMLYYLRQKTVAFGGIDNPATITSRSAIAFVTSAYPPSFNSNGQAENMPFPVFTDMQAVVQAQNIPLTIFHINTQDGGTHHGFGTYQENGPAIKAWLPTVIAAWNGGGGGGGLKPQPAGVYDLTPAPDGHCVVVGKSFLTNPNVDGVRIRPRWNIFNPVSAAYVWTELDAVLDACAAAGKFVGISIAAGVGTPAWVYTTAPTCTKFTLAVDDRTTTAADMPLPWQTGFLSKWQTFVTAMGLKLDGNPFVSYIGITGFMQLVNMILIQTAADLILTDAIAVTDGYANTAAAITFAGKAIIDMFATAFPTTSMILTIDDIIPNGGLITRAIRDYGEATYPNRIGREFSNLLATLPPHDPPILPLDPYPKGFQPINPSNHSGIYGPIDPIPYPLPPQPLEDQGLHCWSDGGKYFEMYEGDVDNADPANQAVIAEIHSLLVTGGGGTGDAPFISSSSPAEGPVGTIVTINGLHFSGTTSVLFGGGPAASFILFSDTLITAVIGPACLTGSITVESPNGVGIGSSFVVTGDGVPPPPPPDEFVVRSPILRYPIGGLPPVSKTRPQPPTALLVTTSGVPGNTTALATWTLGFDGGSPLTSLSGWVTGGSGSVIITGPDATSAAIASLTNDTAYTFHLFATNDYGDSDEAIPFDFLSDPSIVTPPPPSGEPRGLFRLLDIDPVTFLPIWDPLTVPLWTHSYIDGSRYEARWDILNPAYDPVTQTYTYDWADLDLYLAQCATSSKKAIISVSGGIFAPQWAKNLAGNNAQYIETGPDAGTMVYPWNNVILKFWFNFLKVMGTKYHTNTQITAMVASGFGQVVDSILSDNDTDTAKLTANALRFNYLSAADAWLSAAERTITTYDSAFFRSSFILPQLELPVPVLTAVKDGNKALDDLDAYMMSTFPNRMGFIARGITSITRPPNPLIPTDKKYEITFNNSMAGRAAGYRLLTVSTDPNLDPMQDPNSYVPLTGFTRALTKGSDLKGKFLEIFPADADNIAAGYVTAMTAARTALALNP